MRMIALFRFAAIGAVAVTIGACGNGNGSGDDSRTFELKFAAVDGSTPVGCGDSINGLGPTGADRVEISDLRLYVSNLRFETADGELVDANLDANEFQYLDDNGEVALVDFTGTADGACTGGVTYAEGTARTNLSITGSVEATDIRGVQFDVGIPQAMMKSVIANHTAEDAPSPLAEMHWSWAFAYRFLVMNFVLYDGDDTRGEGYLHVGSNDCGGDGSKALTDRDACGKPNAAKVSLTSFDIDNDTIVIDVRQLLRNLDFEVTPVDAPAVPGVECHSSTEQPDCATIFGNLGINQATGSANAASNQVFKVQ